MAKRTNYDRGREIEYKIMDNLRDERLLAFRSAGSHSKFDVIGLRGKRVVLIQSKRTKNFTLSTYKEEVQAIQELIREYELQDFNIQLWVWIDRKGFRKWDVTEDGIKEVG